MNKEKSLLWIWSTFALALLFAVSLASILLDDGGQPYPFTSVRGEQVEIYGGHGLYQYDSVYKALAFRGFDWANLIVVLPVFGLGLYLARRGQLKGQLMLAAVFTYLAYIYLIGVMGNAFNLMFLPWTALFFSGLIGLALLVPRLEIAALPQKLEPRFPRKPLAIYLLALGGLLLFQYTADILMAYAAGQPPAALDHYTTLELAALELGIMVPLHFAGGFWLWRKQGGGYLLAAALAFAASMTFTALSIAQALFYFGYHRGTLADLTMPVILMTLTTGFSLLLFNRVKQ